VGLRLCYGGLIKLGCIVRVTVCGIALLILLWLCFGIGYAIYYIIKTKLKEEGKMDNQNQRRRDKNEISRNCT